ncbi:MAG: lipoyl(octanoyl) transferase [Candidatus Omnitrophica bacterium CG1_02_44_16]|nr:MAG: lipoyl(octanoyl) transferase [Candidatus Omnitrophica bacterium CG1_02_44_16]PIY82790.1 MAG: lipoyl(octanoyl) transferase [Candidatus Omnitrophica bacterium CG_4_10_14_0_8_um_filter_44_12]PIZ84037.1 MAG: lipoyl(octanoyl) transferase [Candidatus Omnitrophica bacterium CG_4_10_14_0_2_um_filter_44_9]
MFECRLLDLGTIDYLKAFLVQKDVVAKVIAGQAPDTLITCEHPHVITLSRRSKIENLLVSQGELKKWGVGIFCANRGGDVTYHGPGQIVLYPIFDLKHDKKDLHLYLRKLEQAVIDTLRENFGLNAYRKNGLTGVWVGPYKVASIGIGVKNWVSYHGLSLNVCADKRYFSFIKSCGLDVKMASINDFFDDNVSVKTVRDLLVESMGKIFSFTSLENRVL